MVKRFVPVAVLCCVSIWLCIPAIAGDTLHLFMHNDHDALIIGEIVSVDGEKCVISVADMIGENNRMVPETVILDATAERTMYVFWGGDRAFSVGDYLVASVNHIEGDLFSIANGAYLLDSPDKSITKLILPPDADEWTRMDTAAIECFLQSNGEYRDFPLMEARWRSSDISVRAFIEPPTTR